MGSVVVLDTNIFIYQANGLLKNPLSLGNFAISLITEIEAFGYKNLTPETESILRALHASVTTIGIDEQIKEEAIRLRKSFTIRTPDAIVVATALVLEAQLYTNDMSLHNIPGLVAVALDLK